MNNKDQFDLDIKVNAGTPGGTVEPNTITTSIPCAQTIAMSIRYCTRITCKGCF